MNVNYVDLTTPQAKVAQFYMHDTKGLNVKPHAVEEIEGQPCWYFYYDLGEDELELEVFFDDELDDWIVVVTCIAPMAQ